jgi:hypothetical protein
MIESVLASVRAHWGDLGLDGPAPDVFRVILQSRSRVILFLFTPLQPRFPVAVAKISRNARENADTELAVSQLRAVRDVIQDKAVLACLPKIMLLEPMRGLSVSLETCLPGDPMSLTSSLLLPNFIHHQRNFRAWRAWLTRFQQATISTAQPGDDMPRSWRYGDAHFSNILLASGRVVGIVDWAGCRCDQPVMADWLQFGFQYLVELNNTRLRNASRNQCAAGALEVMLCPPKSRLSQIIQAETQAFIATWGLDSHQFPNHVRSFLDELVWSENKNELMHRLDSILSAETTWG